jgi:hypothetical protein
MSKVKIDKGIEMPNKKDSRVKYPWESLEVGDSFLPSKDITSSIISSANKRYAPKKFTQRKTEEGIRIWRIE